MKLRNINIIVCDCGAELNPEITTAKDFITYNTLTKTATCSKCKASGIINFPQPPVPPVYVDPTAELAVKVSALAQKLVDKNVITISDKEAIFKATEVVKTL